MCACACDDDTSGSRGDGASADDAGEPGSLELSKLLFALLQLEAPTGGGDADLQCTFMCLRSELGCVYDLSQPRILQLYGLSLVCTCECFLRSELFANRRSQPSYSHLNGFSPATRNDENS